jgi:hypothetical protein
MIRSATSFNFMAISLSTLHASTFYRNAFASVVLSITRKHFYTTSHMTGPKYFRAE